jgi:glyoxylase-like metal-dependent hydrolase (beta-lactamase superfamily II)
VFRFGDDWVNWYLVVDEGRVTVVDAGFPSHWEQFEAGLGEVGVTLDDVDALVLTHGHADHIGFAERLRQTGVPVWVHDADRPLLASGGGKPPKTMLVNLWRPAVMRYFVSALRAGATAIDPVEPAESLADGEALDVPGTPHVVHLPGHSPGHCALVFGDRDVVCVGDALVTVDMRTFTPEVPQMPLVNEDRAAAFVSLARLESLDADTEMTLLPGHGDPWRGRLADAVASAGSLAR